jgi:hypothetical protein
MHPDIASITAQNAATTKGIAEKAESFTPSALSAPLRECLISLNILSIAGTKKTM